MIIATLVSQLSGIPIQHILYYGTHTIFSNKILHDIQSMWRVILPRMGTLSSAVKTSSKAEATAFTTEFNCNQRTWKYKNSCTTLGSFKSVKYGRLRLYNGRYMETTLLAFCKKNIISKPCSIITERWVAEIYWYSMFCAWRCLFASWFANIFIPSLPIQQGK
jgi:hypothetical protein